MTNRRRLFDQLRTLKTEQRNARSLNIDSMSVRDILRTINREDRVIPAAVAREIPYVAKGVDLIVNSLRDGGRLVYIGAGTSGRLGILDASECPPTFGTQPGMIRGIIAGGRSAVFRSKEGAEDQTARGTRDIRLARISAKDVVCGIAASMRTPYVGAGLREAKRRGAHTILVTTNPRSHLRKREFSLLRRSVDVAICPVVGPEVIMGSTRMKSGTAQKLVLNMLTTASMIRMGKVYQNMMIDLRMNSKKLEERAKRVLMIATGVDYPAAARALKNAGGHVKTAIVMLESGLSARAAHTTLNKNGGFVRRTLKNL